MSTHEEICEYAGRDDLGPRYLADRLSAQEAETFEAHYFGCDACSQRVQRALELRAAFRGADARAPAAEVPDTRSPGAGNWWPMAAGVAVAALLLGTWQITSDNGVPDSDAMRGPGDSLQVSTRAEPGRLAASWPSVPEADVYRVRLFSGTGTLLLERETRGNELEIRGESLSGLEPGRVAYWSVEALDELRRSVARSELVEAVPVAIP
ncbi:MAG: zf-HC2 domain-containing protein [Gammaproteobacteria bacterium]|nr:zf-HC2 domain-containing protein [Gammaproteobacteria bacterium]